MAGRKGAWRQADDGPMGFSTLSMRARYDVFCDTANQLMARCYKAESDATAHGDIAVMDEMRVERIQVAKDVNKTHADDPDALMALYWKWRERCRALDRKTFEAREKDPLKGFLADTGATEPDREELHDIWDDDIRPFSFANIRPSSEPTMLLLVGAAADCPRLMRRAARSMYPLGGIADVDRTVYEGFHPAFLEDWRTDPFTAGRSTGAAADSWMAESMRLAGRNRLNTVTWVDPARTRLLAQSAGVAKRRVTVLLQPCRMVWGRLSVAERFLFDRVNNMVGAWVTPDGYAKDRAAVEGFVDDMDGLGLVSRIVVLDGTGGVLYDGADLDEARSLWHGRSDGDPADGELDAVRERVGELRHVAGLLGLDGADAFLDWVLEG